VSGQQEGEGGGGEPEISEVRLVVATAEPVGKRSAEECYCGEEQRAAEGAHGLCVEIEKVSEGERVVAGILLEQRCEVGVGAGCLGVQDEESGDEGSDATENKQRDRDALAGADERVGDDEGFGFDSFAVEPRGDEEHHGWECGQDVVLLASGERKEEERDQRPEAEEEASALVLIEDADGDEGSEGFAPGNGGDGSEEEGAPGHEPDEDEAPEESEGDGVIVVGDAKVEVAEEMFVDEVEPEPAADVAVGGEGDRPVAVDEGEVAGMTLSGVREGDEDVPRCGDGEEDEGAGDWMELANTGDDGAKVATGEDKVGENDEDGEDDADEALGEDVEGAADCEGPAEDAAWVGFGEW